MSLRSDQLVATIGVLADKATPAQIVASSKMLSRWESRLKKIITGEREKWEYREPPKDLDKIFRQCAEPYTVPPEMIHEFATDAEMTAGLAVSMPIGRKYIVDSWPACTIITESGAKQLPMAVGEDDEISTVIYILDDTEKTLFAAMESCSLEPQQVNALSLVMPDLYQWTLATVEEIKKQQVAKDKAWEPDHEIAGTLRVLSKLPPEIPFVPPVQPPTVPMTYKPSPDRVATQDQLVGEPVGRENPSGQ